VGVIVGVNVGVPVGVAVGVLVGVGVGVFGFGFSETLPRAQCRFGDQLSQLIVTEGAPASVLPPPQTPLTLSWVWRSQRCVWPAPTTGELVVSPRRANVSKTTSPVALATVSVEGPAVPPAETKAPRGAPCSTPM